MTHKISLTFIVILMVLLGGCRDEPTNITTVTIIPTSTMEPTPSLIPSPTTAPTATPDRSVENGLPVVARVNGQPIFKELYDRKLAEKIQRLEQDGIDLNTTDGQRVLVQHRQMVLNELIDQLVIEHAVTQRAITVTTNTLDDLITALSNSPESPDFEVWLAENNLSLDAYRELLRFELLSQRLKEQVISSVPDIADQIQLQYLIIANKTEAATIFQQLQQEDVSFETLIQQYPNQQAGIYATTRWLPAGSGILPSHVEAVAFSGELGHVSEPISSNSGFYIVKVVDKQPDRPLTEVLKQQLQQHQFFDWLLQQRSIVAIEQYNKD
ncbi:SurA N-terminal domain-containing protein [Anaerolineales bacterium HSG25]|nr:SurA N-terminal domain-containing protein [Anaerolineales bacterium HSG25]